MAMILAWFASLHLVIPTEFLALPSHDEMEINAEDYAWLDGGCW